MLEITIPRIQEELFNEKTEEFIYIDIKETKLQMEHSLLSVKKWEQKWKKPFLEKEKTEEELLDYLRCMTLTKNVDPKTYLYMPKEIIKQIVDYIEDPMTATWFRDNSLIGAQMNRREKVTAELIYYWMITLSVPIEFEKWHLNQLLTLIKVIDIKSRQGTKEDKIEAAKARIALNEARKKKYHTRG